MCKIVFSLLFLYLSLLNVNGEGEFVVLSSPKGIQFSGNDELSGTVVKNIFLHSLGLPVEEGSDWEGMFMKTAFDYADALICFEGISLKSNGEGTYPLVSNINEEDIFDILFRKLSARYPKRQVEVKKIIIDETIKQISGSEIKEVDVPVSNAIQPSSNSSGDNDDIFIEELNKLQAVVYQILEKKHKKGVPDVYWFACPRLSKIMQNRDDDSSRMLVKMLLDFTKKFEDKYDKKALIAAVTDNEEDLGGRSKRETTTPQYTRASLKVADDYDENFPVIFNIILWFSLILLFSLIAISMVIAGMDPGRDSIIYRMTSTRMKKDN